MNKNIFQLLDKATPEELDEIETFINYLIVRRRLKKHDILNDDVSIDELTKLIEDSGSFNWLNKDPEDIYSINDGVPVQW